MERSLRAGITAIIISVAINLFSPINLYFIPSFFASIIVIYMSRLVDIKDGLIVALITYLFNLEILNFVAAGLLLGSAYTIPVIDLGIVLSPIFDLITVVLAAYAGVSLARRAKPAHEMPPPLPPPTPIPPV